MASVDCWNENKMMNERDEIETKIKQPRKRIFVQPT
jgi:hypothetical protein